MSSLTKKSDTHQERYVHLELHDHPRVHHVTVYARQIFSKDSPSNAWGMAAAFCVHGDQFSRRLGRQIARRTYFSKPDRRWHLGQAFTFQAAADLALKLAAEMKG